MMMMIFIPSLQNLNKVACDGTPDVRTSLFLHIRHNTVNMHVLDWRFQVGHTASEQRINYLCRIGSLSMLNGC